MNKRTGRPAYLPTAKDRNQVETMSGIGIQQELIARVIGVTEPTLRKHFKAELEVGKAKAITKVAQSLYEAAVNGNIAAMIFFLKTQGGWREKDPAEEKGKKEQNQDKAVEAQKSLYSGISKKLKAVK